MYQPHNAAMVSNRPVKSVMMVTLTTTMLVPSCVKSMCAEMDIFIPPWKSAMTAIQKTLMAVPILVNYQNAVIKLCKVGSNVTMATRMIAMLANQTAHLMFVVMAPSTLALNSAMMETPSMMMVCTNQCTTPTCGDGIAQAGEECDDGNANNNDACTNACATNICGDGFVETGVEECDDGNNVDEDSCTNACKNNNLW